MRILASLIVISMLAACGADGPPIRPTAKTKVSVGDNGTRVSTEATATRAGWTFGLGLGF